MCNNLKLDVFNINAYTQFGQILSIFLKILSCNEILTSIKGYNAVINKWKLTHNNPNLDFININAYGKFWQIPSICSQDTERKQNSDIDQGL